MDLRLEEVAMKLFTRIALRVSAEGDAEGVARWLADLEEGEKLIRVRALAISAPEPASRYASPRAEFLPRLCLRSRIPR